MITPNTCPELWAYFSDLLGPDFAVPVVAWSERARAVVCGENGSLVEARLIKGFDRVAGPPGSEWERRVTLPADSKLA